MTTYKEYFKDDEKLIIGSDGTMLLFSNGEYIKNPKNIILDDWEYIQTISDTVFE